MNLASKGPMAEVLGGLTTFFTMAYIVVVNPAILCTEGTGMPFSGVLTATVLLAFSMTLLMGLYAKLPFAVAPGMGINAFFTFTLVLGQKVPWPVALGMVFWAGVIFLVLSILPVREKIAEAIPLHLRKAAAAGIGLFLTFIGLKNMGLVVADAATFVRLGHLSSKVLVSVLGFVPAFLLLRRKSPFAFLSTIAFVTVVYGLAGWISMPSALFSRPDMSSVFFKLDVKGALAIAFLPAIVAIAFTDLFDSISTFVGVSEATGLLDGDRRPKNLRQGLLVDALATLGAGLFGTSSGTAYIESAAGIEAGGRTGWSAVVTAVAFLPCLFLGPLVAIVPPQATGPVLVLLGVLMLRESQKVARERLEEEVPFFLTMVLIPLTFSITQGMLWGFLSHIVLFSLCGRAREIRPIMWIIGVVALLLLWVEHGRA